MRKMVAIACLLLGAVSAGAAPADDFHKLLDDHWSWWLAENPSSAAMLGQPLPKGVPAGKLEDLSLAGMDRSAAEAAAFRKRLAAIPRDALTQQDRESAEILDQLLARQVEGNRFPARAATLFSGREGFHSYFADLPDQLPFFTRADYDAYLDRLAGFPAMVEQAIATTRQAVQDGQALPCVVTDGLERGIRAAAAPPESSRFLAPFARRPATIAEADWAQLKSRATALVTEKVNPAYLRFADYIGRDYLPACTRSVGAGERPMGRDYYRMRVRQETTTDLTPDQIHEIGLQEVARIRAEMEALAKKAGFPSREAYVQHLRTDPAQYARTPEELMAAASRQAKIADGWMPRLFGKLPRLPYGVKEIPAAIAEGTTTAYYMPGSLASGQAGTYFVNTSKLGERPLFELPALTIHEAVPGHHHQISLAQELDLPAFRRYIAFFTAFTEGWGLYSERLGIEMGMYDTPERDMGRLSYEMWRATRLVVDTGMHWKGWSKEQAVQYMLDNTALSAANIDAEVNRYIAWPGQALGYKIGAMEIGRLRAEAETALGTRFDLRAFHDKVLESGAVPLDLLQQKVRAWIAEEKAKG